MVFQYVLANLLANNDHALGALFLDGCSPLPPPTGPGADVALAVRWTGGAVRRISP